MSPAELDAGVAVAVVGSVAVSAVVSGSGWVGVAGAACASGCGSPLSSASSEELRLERCQAARLPVLITTSRTTLLKGGLRGSPRPSSSSSCTALLPRLKPLSHNGVWRSTRKLSPFTLMRRRQRASSPRRFCRGASSSSQSISTGSICCSASGLAAISWALPLAGSSAALRATRFSRIWALAPGAFTASPQGRAAYTVTRWLPGRRSGMATLAAASVLLIRSGS